MTDAEIRGKLLKHFYNLRDKNGGWVPTAEIILSPDPISRQVIADTCQHLAEAGYIRWEAFSPLIEQGTIGRAKITAPGIDVVTMAREPTIEIRFADAKEYGARSRSPSAGLSDSIGAEGRRARFDKWESLGLDRVKGDLLAGGNLIIGGPAAVRELAWEWVHLKEAERKQPALTDPPTSETKIPSRKVFVVHGRDSAAKNEVALFLRAIDLDPIILHQRPNGGRHLLTKFTEESEGAAFAVILMTPDDEGGLAGAEDKRPRARQNVVFELGFFIGKLGSANVAALMKDDVEKPSDFDGIAYITLDSNDHWKKELARELRYANVPFDSDKMLTA